jgi:hypothetical protein
MLEKRRGTAVSSFRLNPDVVAQRVDDQTVLVNLATNRIFALNRTGARLWELLKEGRNKAEICTELSAEYSADPGNIREEVDQLLRQLDSESLVESFDDD